MEGQNLSVATVAPLQLDRLQKQGKRIRLIDVRTPAEFREVHAEFAVNIPSDQLDPKKVIDEEGSPREPIYVICRTGSRACKVAERLTAAGHGQVFNVEGGTVAWEAAGLPVIRGKKTIALERQVRIAAGSLVLLGVALGYFIHPLGFLISAFVGAGLVFSGVTDTCGMGMLLARMPWNRAGA